MRGQKVRHAALAELVHARERSEKTRDAARVPSSLRRVLHAHTIRLALVVSPVLEKRDAHADRSDVAEGARRRHEDAEREQSKLAAGRARVLLRGMPCRDMRDLMAQHTRKLRLVVQVRQDAARDVDESARERKRVDGLVIDDGKRPRQVGPVRELRETMADVRDVSLQFRIVVHAHLSADFGVVLLADGNLLRFAQKRELAFACDGIGRARREERRNREGGKDAPDHVGTR